MDILLTTRIIPIKNTISKNNYLRLNDFIKINKKRKNMKNINEISKTLSSISCVSEVLYLNCGMLSIEFYNKSNEEKNERNCLLYDLKNSLFGWTSEEFISTEKEIDVLLSISCFCNNINAKIKFGKIFFTIRKDMAFQIVYECFDNGFYEDIVTEARNSQKVINGFIDAVKKEGLLFALNIFDKNNYLKDGGEL